MQDSEDRTTNTQSKEPSIALRINNDTSRRRLLVLTSTFPVCPDDAEPGFVYELCAALATDFDVTVLAPATQRARGSAEWGGIRIERFRYGPSFCERLAGIGGMPARLKRFPALWLMVPALVIAQCLAIVRMHLREPFDAIHAHWIVPQGFSAVIAAALLRKPPPIVLTAHGADVYGLQGAIMKAIKAFALRRVSCVAAVSEGMRTDVIRDFPFLADSVELGPMGVDVTGQFQPAEKRPGTVTFVGRLVEKKGVLDLINAFARVLAENADCSLTIAGDGPLRKDLQNRVNVLGIGNHVQFLGAISKSQVAALMATSEICVVPSKTARDGDREGLGLVAIEALACGCGLVISDYAAATDIAEDGVHALFFHQGNSEELGNCILRLLRDPNTCTVIAANGRRRVQTLFDWEVAASRYAEIFRTLGH